jgi:hypothetical protein
VPAINNVLSIGLIPLDSRSECSHQLLHNTTVIPSKPIGKKIDRFSYKWAKCHRMKAECNGM